MYQLDGHSTTSSHSNSPRSHEGLSDRIGNATVPRGPILRYRRDHRWRTVAVSAMLLGLLGPSTLLAQLTSSPPTPDQLPELTSQANLAAGELATDVPVADDPNYATASEDAASVDSSLNDAPLPFDADMQPARHTSAISRYGTMTPWDLYAGSVYANTSPLWVRTEGLVWWMRGNSLPPLVTTSPAGTPREAAGVLGANTTTVLHGGELVDDRARGGFRTSMGVRLGHWFDHYMNSELEFDLLWVGDGQSSGDFYAASLGEPILARPFDNLAPPQSDSQLVAFPDVVTGDISVETSSEFLSAGALFHQSWRSWGHSRLDWLAGYRYARLKERLLMEEGLISVEDGGDVAVGTAFDLYDDFRTWSEFHGADLGLQFWTRTHGWTVEILGKMAIGANIRTVQVDGQTWTFVPSQAAAQAPGGLLTMPSNIGRFQSSQFSVLPEFTLRLRRPLSRFFTLTVGYTAVVLTNVMRTGDQVDLTVNLTQANNGVLIGPARPAVPMNDSTLWVHGFTLGLEW